MPKMYTAIYSSVLMVSFLLLTCFFFAANLHTDKVINIWAQGCEKLSVASVGTFCVIVLCVLSLAAEHMRPMGVISEGVMTKRWWTIDNPEISYPVSKADKYSFSIVF